MYTNFLQVLMRFNTIIDYTMPRVCQTYNSRSWQSLPSPKFCQFLAANASSWQPLSSPDLYHFLAANGSPVSPSITELSWQLTASQQLFTSSHFCQFMVARVFIFLLLMVLLLLLLMVTMIE